MHGAALASTLLQGLLHNANGLHGHILAPAPRIESHALRAQHILRMGQPAAPHVDLFSAVRTRRGGGGGGGPSSASEGTRGLLRPLLLAVLLAEPTGLRGGGGGGTRREAGAVDVVGEGAWADAGGAAAAFGVVDAAMELRRASGLDGRGGGSGFRPVVWREAEDDDAERGGIVDGRALPVSVLVVVVDGGSSSKSISVPITGPCASGSGAGAGAGFGGAVAMPRLLGRGDVADENRQDAAGVGEDKVRVDLEIGLAAVADQQKAAVREVAQNLLEGAALALRDGLENALQHAAVLLEVQRPPGQAGLLEEGGQHGEQLPGAVGAVVELDAEVVQARVPRAGALDGHAGQLLDKGVAEDLARPERNVGGLDGVVNVADEADAAVLDEVDGGDGGQRLGQAVDEGGLVGADVGGGRSGSGPLGTGAAVAAGHEHAHVGGHKIEGGAGREVAGVRRGDGARLRLRVVVEEERHRLVDDGRGEEGPEAGQQVRVGGHELGLGQLGRGRAAAAAGHWPRRLGRQFARSCRGRWVRHPCVAMAGRVVRTAVVVVAGGRLGRLAVAAAVGDLLLALAAALNGLGGAHNLLCFARVFARSRSRSRVSVRRGRRHAGVLSRRDGRPLVRRRNATQPAGQAYQDAVLARQRAAVGQVQPAVHVDVHDGLFVFETRKRLVPVGRRVRVAADLHALAGRVGVVASLAVAVAVAVAVVPRASGHTFPILAHVPLCVHGEQHHLGIAARGKRHVGERAGYVGRPVVVPVAGRRSAVAVAHRPRRVVLVADLAGRGHAGAVDIVGERSKAAAAGAALGGAVVAVVAAAAAVVVVRVLHGEGEEARGQLLFTEPPATRGAVHHKPVETSVRALAVARERLETEADVALAERNAWRRTQGSCTAGSAVAGEERGLGAEEVADDGGRRGSSRFCGWRWRWRWR
ncbi:hypothetical protein SPBR_00162 [Sporothrix brasiliensis 5110]|uniref:Uncharacterized protein n=1 Tax=Sporothrix brasiliensis 5110 TaxID=1398154 RepID=A0A0C2FHF2_9PEZI|nr:uncharacterized protein SPBR_00162 [Sporothrix brasiliensis 5110]KIH90508.1 hypothetical protein SPBR_00162 [Sporothrix brasiliensis 5110]